MSPYLCELGHGVGVGLVVRLLISACNFLESLAHSAICCLIIDFFLRLSFAKIGVACLFESNAAGWQLILKPSLFMMSHPCL